MLVVEVLVVMIVVMIVVVLRSSNFGSSSRRSTTRSRSTSSSNSYVVVVVVVVVAAATIPLGGAADTQHGNIYIYTHNCIYTQSFLEVKGMNITNKIQHHHCKSLRNSRDFH